MASLKAFDNMSRTVGALLSDVCVTWVRKYMLATKFKPNGASKKTNFSTSAKRHSALFARVAVCAAVWLGDVPLSYATCTEPDLRSNAENTKISSPYNMNLDQAEDRIRQIIMQHINRKSGAIALKPIGAPNNHINPWFSYPAASALLDSGPSYYPYVKNWLHWMCGHVNHGDMRDIYGTDHVAIQDLRSDDLKQRGVEQHYRGDEWSGTFFKYEIDRAGNESKIFLLTKPLKKASKSDHALHDAITATDNWSASFLITADRYIALSGDADFAGQCREPLRLAADHIVSLLTTHPGGRLTRAAPDNRIQYATDNMYSRAGLSAYSSILKRLNASDYSKYGAYADQVEDGIVNLLYNNGGKYISTYRGQKAFDWYQFYGDAVANVTGATVDGSPRISKLSKLLWSKFISTHASWSYFFTIKSDRRHSTYRFEDRSRGGKWSMISYAAVKLGDVPTALSFVYNTYEMYGGFADSADVDMDVNELGWLLRAIISLRGAVIADDLSATCKEGDVRQEAFQKPSVDDVQDVSILLRQEAVRVGRSQSVLGRGSVLQLPLKVQKPGRYAIFAFDNAPVRLSETDSAEVSCSGRERDTVRAGSGIPRDQPSPRAHLLTFCRLLPTARGFVRFHSPLGGELSVDGLAIVPDNLVSGEKETSNAR